jgi:hypothetical protein
MEKGEGDEKCNIQDDGVESNELNT